MSFFFCDRIKPQILVSTPVSFSLVIVDDTTQDDEGATEYDLNEARQWEQKRSVPSGKLKRRSTEATKHSLTSLFSCVTFGACVEGGSGSELTVPQRSPRPLREKILSSNDRMYVALDTRLYDTGTHLVQTKAPMWNAELGEYAQNYGGRVRVPSNRNFIATHVTQTGTDEHYYSSGIEDQEPDTLCLRHGQVRS